MAATANVAARHGGIGMMAICNQDVDFTPQSAFFMPVGHIDPHSHNAPASRAPV
jgi:hypothetical protein